MHFFVHAFFFFFCDHSFTCVHFLQYAELRGIVTLQSSRVLRKGNLACIHYTGSTYINQLQTEALCIYTAGGYCQGFSLNVIKYCDVQMVDKRKTINGFIFVQLCGHSCVLANWHFPANEWCTVTGSLCSKLKIKEATCFVSRLSVVICYVGQSNLIHHIFQSDFLF